MTEHLRGGSLHKAGLLAEAVHPDCVEHVLDREGVHLEAVGGHGEGVVHVTLGSEVVNFVRFGVADQAVEELGIIKVANVEVDLARAILTEEVLRCLLEALDEVQGGRVLADDAVNFVVIDIIEEQVRRHVAAVLASNTSDDGNAVLEAADFALKSFDFLLGRDHTGGKTVVKFHV